MARTNGRARDGQAPAPSAADYFAEFREYVWVDLDPPYAPGRVEVYVNPSDGEAQWLSTQPVLAQLRYSIRAWNLELRDGTPIPIADDDTWRRLPVNLQLQILRKWGKARQDAENLALGASSPATTAAPPSPTPAAPASSSPDALP